MVMEVISGKFAFDVLVETLTGLYGILAIFFVVILISTGAIKTLSSYLVAFIEGITLFTIDMANILIAGVGFQRLEKIDITKIHGITARFERPKLSELLKELYKKAFWGFVNTVVNTVKGAFNTAIGLLKGGINSLITAVNDVLRVLGLPTIPTLNGVLNGVTNGLNGVTNGVTPPTPTPTPSPAPAPTQIGAGSVIDAIVDSGKALLGSVIKAIKPYTLVDNIISGTSKVIGGAVNYAKDLLGWK